MIENKYNIPPNVNMSDHATIGRMGKRDGTSLDRCDVEREERPRASDIDAEETPDNLIVKKTGNINWDVFQRNVPWHARMDTKRRRA